MKDLIKKYEIQADVLLKIMQSTYSNEEEIEKAAVSRRFVTGFIYDLKMIENNNKHVDIDRSGNWNYSY